MKQKRITLIVAATLALGTGFLTLNYLSSVRSANAADFGQLRTIVVAAQDIPARVTITRAMLKPAQRNVSAVEPDAIVDPRRAIGSYSLIGIPAGASITSSKIGHPQKLGLSAELRPGMRAVSIGIDKVKGVSDLIQPGDRVDVIAVAARTGAETPVARTILRGALVLALGAALESVAPANAADPNTISTVTLGVTPDQANILASADINSILRLALRSPQEPLNSLRAQPFVLPAAQSAPEQQPVQVQPVPLQQPQPSQVRPAAEPVRSSPKGSGIPVIDGNGSGP